jgi:molybdate transport system substrate-binding protein
VSEGIIRLPILAAAMLLFPGIVIADEIRVAVASNFSTTLGAIAQRFEAQTDHKIVLISGATGKHYAQIINGAPFDAFFAADSQRPEILDGEGIAVAGSRFTYALGKLVLWSPEAGYVDPQGHVLANEQFRYLAIANPKLAPYGRAAREVLHARNLDRELVGRIVRGENIAQAFQFVASGNAELGLVALSQIQHPNRPVEGSWWEVPPALYSPIEQQAVLLHENPVARAFLIFVRSPEALEIIHDYGYDTP